MGGKYTDGTRRLCTGAFVPHAPPLVPRGASFWQEVEASTAPC